MNLNLFIKILTELTPYLSILFGLLIGSFLTVCVHRLPLGRTKGLASLDEDGDEDSLNPVVTPEETANSSQVEALTADDSQKITFFYPRRSLCPNCKKMLNWWMNIPVFSWLFLRGRCQHCKAPISWRYPLIELLTAFFCFLSFTSFPPLTALVVFIFCASMIVISFIDLEYYIIPNVVTFPGMLIAIVLAFINQFKHVLDFPLVDGIEQAGLGLLCGGGFLWLVSATYKLVRRREGLGFGDVKLMAMVGLLFGPQAAIVGIFVGSTLGTIIGVVYILFSKEKFSRPLPFGPFLALGSIFYIFMTPWLALFSFPIFRI